MGVERVDYYNDDEYQQALQQEEMEEYQRQQEQEALNRYERDDYFGSIYTEDEY